MKTIFAFILVDWENLHFSVDTKRTSKDFATAGLHFFARGLEIKMSKGILLIKQYNLR